MLGQHHCTDTTKAVSYGRLRFELTGVEMTEPSHITHKEDGTQGRWQIELERGNDPADSIYTSEIWECFHALPKYVRQLVGDIPELTLPENFDCTEPTDLIVATDGSVLFGVGYHSWLVSTKEEHTLLHGGGPEDGAPLYMTSYRS
jgi:hypothetical protein